MKSQIYYFTVNKGISRSVSVMIGYLMVSKRMSFDEAFAMIKEKRPSIDPNIGFVAQLQWLDEFLQKHYEELKDGVFDYEIYKKFEK